MLIKFKVNKFRGFSQELCWDLSTPSNYEYNTFAIKNGIIKNGIVFGPNGSGKSNFSKSIFDIIYHLSSKEKLADYYQYYLNACTPNELVDFEYTFKFGDTLLVYTYSKNAEGVLMAESLNVDGRQIFSRSQGKLDFDTQEFPLNQDTLNTLANNANNISIVNFLLLSYPLNANHYLLQLREFVNGMLWFVNLDFRGYMGLELGSTSLQEYIIKNGLTDKFATFLKDISGQEYEFSRPQADDKTLYCSFGANKVPFLNIVSTGTSALMLIFFWLQRLNNATFVFVDEFDAFYHFDLSKKVCQALFSLDCQVFTTSHNTSLMSNDLLRPDCYFILNNNKIKPFYQCTDKELRFAHNLEKMYRGGALEV